MHEGKPKGRRGYPEAVRRKVLARLASGRTSMHQLSKETKISMPTLVNWRKKEREECAERAAGSEAVADDTTKHSGSSKDENERLREEIDQLKKERDRLRGAIATLIGIKVTDK